MYYVQLAVVSYPKVKEFLIYEGHMAAWVKTTFF